MECCFLSGSYLLCCGADGRPYVPSSFEIDEYCTSRRHKICPLFFRVTSKAEKRSEEPSFSGYGHMVRSIIQLKSAKRGGNNEI